MTKNLQDFYNDLGISESSGNYKAKNSLGYIGKYQMGEAALIDAGYYTKKSGNYNNDWSGQFTGKDGVYSADDFLNNPIAQENAQVAFKKKQWSYLKNLNADKYVGTNINGLIITPSALLGGAHILGQSNVDIYLKSNGKINPKDANGVSVEDYMRKFADYDVSKITNSSSISKNKQSNPLNTMHYSLQKFVRPEFLPNPLEQYGVYPENLRFYTFEELKRMPYEKVRQNQRKILEAFTSGRMIHENEAKEKVKSGELIYVDSYTRQDGTKVSGYYRRR